MVEFEIDGKRITDDSKAYVIAEIGNNHMGDIEVCKQLFLEAKHCGADAVKLQKRNNKKLFTKEVYDRPYDNPNSYGKTYGEHREYLEFDYDQYRELQKYCKKINITFFATAFDIDSADFLESLDIPAYKIASWDIVNIPLIKHIACFDKPIILSTGGANLKDIFRAVTEIEEIHQKVAILHCIADYPAKSEDIKIETIELLMREFSDYIVGYSCHYNGILMAEAAYIHGARIIEKHFTLDHTWRGTDHALSLEPAGFAKLCRDLKRLYLALDSRTERLPCEDPVIKKMGNAIHPARTIKKGSVITENDIAIKAPQEGILPYDYDKVLGKIAVSEISTADTLEWNKLEGKGGE